MTALQAGGQVTQAAPRRTRPLRATPRLRHTPGLDALRGLAVAAVVAYHSGVVWLPGGFVGVGLFFTLSGFLIMFLLLPDLDERDVRLGRFWSRRARRILPPAVAVVVGVVAWSVLSGRLDPHRTSRDGLAALAYVANWRFLLSGRSYSAMFSSPSPLLHFWSLAVEEQYYLALPVVVWLCARCRHPRAALVAVLVAVIAYAARAGTAGWSLSRIYYGTDVRAGEIAVGALLAVVVDQAHFLENPPRWVREVVVHAQAPALAVTVWVLVALHQTSALITDGVLLWLSVCWVALILGAVLGVGPVAALAGVRWLTGLGAISYAVYLLHWPLLCFVHPTANRALNASIAVALSIGLAAVSRRWFEGPIRRRSAPPPALAVLCAASVVCVVVLALAAPGAAGSPLTTIGLPTVRAAAPAPVPATDGVTPASAASPAAATTPLRILVLGDSTADNLGAGLRAVGAGLVEVDDQGVPGCSLADAAQQSMVEHPDLWASVSPACGDWARRLAPEFAAFRPQVVIAMFGPTQTADLRLPDGIVGSVLDPSVTAASLAEGRALEALAPRARWLWATSPETFSAGDGIPQRDWVVDDPARTAAWNAIVAQLGAMPGAAILNAAAWVDTRPGGWHNGSVRPDGTHLSPEALSAISRWTLGQI